VIQGASSQYAIRAHNGREQFNREPGGASVTLITDTVQTMGQRQRHVEPAFRRPHVGEVSDPFVWLVAPVIENDGNL
jgi:hypothetical protein